MLYDAEICDQIPRDLNGHDKAFSVGMVVNDITIGKGGRGFDSRAGQIIYSVPNLLPPLRRFFEAELPRR